MTGKFTKQWIKVGLSKKFPSTTIWIRLIVQLISLGIVLIDLFTSEFGLLFSTWLTRDFRYLLLLVGYLWQGFDALIGWLPQMGSEPVTFCWKLSPKLWCGILLCIGLSNILKRALQPNELPLKHTVWPLATFGPLFESLTHSPLETSLESRNQSFLTTRLKSQGCVREKDVVYHKCPIWNTGTSLGGGCLEICGEWSFSRRSPGFSNISVLLTRATYFRYYSWILTWRWFIFAYFIKHHLDTLQSAEIWLRNYRFHRVTSMTHQLWPSSVNDSVHAEVKTCS